METNLDHIKTPKQIFAHNCRELAKQHDTFNKWAKQILAGDLTGLNDWKNFVAGIDMAEDEVLPNAVRHRHFFILLGILVSGGLEAGA